MNEREMLGILGWLAFVTIVVGLPVCCIFGLPWLARIRRENLQHAVEMAKIKAGKNEQSDSDLQQVRERCDSLEKRCTKLEEQLKDAHLLLADEQRALDKKLASIIPDEATESRARSSAPSKTVM